MSDLDLRTYRVKRVLSPGEAAEINGAVVPNLDANLTEAGIYADADTNEPFFLYFPLDRPTLSDLRRALLKIPESTVIRQTTGVRTSSRTFGMAPRKVFQKRESCRPTSLAYDAPEQHALLISLAERFGEILERHVPDAYRADMATAAVADEWKMTPKATWTSGVINHTSVLPYHRDGGNFDVWSAMPVVRRDVRGGYLNIPEYDVTCAARDGWVTMFPGYRLVHGVTPMAKEKPDGYRISTVYYALRGMKDCFTFALEQSEALKRRTARERNLADGIANPDASAFGQSRKPKE